MRKKKIVYQSNFSKSKTGFGRHAKAILTHLFETGKYDIVEYAGAPFTLNDANVKALPWKGYGAMPDNKRRYQEVMDNPKISRAAQYGGLYIDKIIEDERPDAWIGVEDFWAFNEYWDKPWWNKFACLIWTTLDSLPLLPMVTNNADKVENFWVWADFAREELHKLGHAQVETVHGAITSDSFKPLSEPRRRYLRGKNDIDEDTLVFGFVFRNQLRKLVYSLLEGFAEFKRQNPKQKAKLILHTHWEEKGGWKIKDFIREFKIDPADVLTTYVCTHCRNVQVLPYRGQGLECGNCENRTLTNPHSVFGCSERALNEIYNMMDGYVHLMTSGGMEIPVAEAMLAGLPVATVGYSCGLEYTKNDFVFTVRHTEYREQASNFIKAQANFRDVAKFMGKVARMSRDKRKELGRRGREWALEEFSIERIGKRVEHWLDSLPFSDYDYDFQIKECQDDFPLKGKDEIPDDLDWLLDLYRGTLNMTETAMSQGVRAWMADLEKGERTREEIHAYFIREAKKKNSKEIRSYRDDLAESDKKKIAYVMPQSFGDCFISTCILERIRELYPDYDIYVATDPKYGEMFQHLGFVRGILPYTQSMDSFQWWEGMGQQRGIVDIAFQPYMLTQRAPVYCHNGEDINELQ